LTYGIGNPLIDVVIRVTNDELASLGINKGIMHLVSEADQARILGALEGKARTYLPGGSAPNTMLALAGMGADAVISGKIGDDEFGRTYGAQIAAYGIESRLAQGKGATGSCVILVTPDGERSMNTHLGMCHEFSRADLDEGLLARADYLYFTGYMLAAGFLAGLALGQGARKASVLAGELAERVIAKTGAQFGFEEISAIRRELLVAPDSPAHRR
jgi:sugar/nucleoside kinase (ribokinase family)